MYPANCPVINYQVAKKTMTLFMDVNDLDDIIRHNGPAGFIRGLLGYLEHDFSHWQEFDKSARTVAHSNVGVIELMPVADTQNHGFKYVSGHPGNPENGLSTVMRLAHCPTWLPAIHACCPNLPMIMMAVFYLKKRHNRN